MRALKYSAREMATTCRCPPDRRLEDLARLHFHEVVVQGAPGRHLLAAEKEVGHRVEVVGQRQRLVDGLDALGLRLRGRADLHLLARDDGVARVDGVGAGQHLHQRGLARAVVAQQRHHFARM